MSRGWELKETSFQGPKGEGSCLNCFLRNFLEIADGFDLGMCVFGRGVAMLSFIVS